MTAMQCVTEKMMTCSQDDRVTIGTYVLPVIEGIVGSGWCGLDLPAAICEARKLDPATVCDLEAAAACTGENYVVGNPFAADEDKCL